MCSVFEFENGALIDRRYTDYLEFGVVTGHEGLFGNVFFSLLLIYVIKEATLHNNAYLLGTIKLQKIQHLVL